MEWHPPTQDIRASQILLVSDGILENNPGAPPDYSPYDDSLDGVHMNCFNDPDKVYFYVPAETHTVRGRLVDKSLVESYLKGMTVTLLNTYYLMDIKNIESATPTWSYPDSLMSFERYVIQNFQPTWCGFNMASQWYWLSDEEMLNKPEYIECATFSIAKSALERAERQLSPMMTQDDLGRELEALYAVIKS